TRRASSARLATTGPAGAARLAAGPARTGSSTGPSSATCARATRAGAWRCVIGGKRRCLAIRIPRAGGSARATRASAAGRLAAGGLACARAGVAVPGRAGVDAIGHVPAAERGRVALGQGALVLALLERIVRLSRGRLAGDRKAAGWLARSAATTAAVLANVVEAPQLAALVGRAVAADVALAAVLATHLHGGLGGAALADHRQQGQCGRCAILEPELAAQGLDLVIHQ